jgi:hypothetical protein
MAEDDGGDGTVLKREELSRLLRKIDLIEEHSDANTDEDYRDDGGPLSRVVIVKWNHGGPS